MASSVGYTGVGGVRIKDEVERLKRAESFLSSSVSRRLARLKISELLLEGATTPPAWMEAMVRSSRLEDAQAIARGEVPAWCPPDMSHFIREASALALGRTCEPRGRALDKNVDIGLSVKKKHEVEEMSAVVAEVSTDVGSKVVVDLGSGKGYLGQALCLQYGLSVVGIEAVADRNCSSQARTRRVQRLQRREEAPDLASMTRELSPHMVFDEELRQLCEGAVIVTLHACGDLTPTAMRLFTETDTSAILAVGCCYHLATRFPMGPTLRGTGSTLDMERDGNLACHSLEEWSERDAWKLKSHGYRAVLQKLLVESGIDDVPQFGRLRVKVKEHDTFSTYARRLLERVPKCSAAVRADAVDEFERRYGASVTPIACIYALRYCAANIFRPPNVVLREAPS